MDSEILRHIGFTPSSHNEIFYDHLETIIDFFRIRSPIEKKKALAMLRGSMGISNRYVKEHIESLIAWDIIKSKGGYYEWVFGIKIEDIKPEDVPDTFPGNIGEVKEEYPICKVRIDNQCTFFEGKPFTPSFHRCVACKSRQEA